MSSTDPRPTRLSAPELPNRLPREPTAAERAALGEIADVLIPAQGTLPRGSEAPGFQDALTRALRARVESLGAVLAAASAVVGSDRGTNGALRALATEDPRTFQVLTAVVAGAYLIIPEVRAEIGYPGQERKFARFDESAEELMNGILDPVIERGPIYQEA